MKYIFSGTGRNVDSHVNANVVVENMPPTAAVYAGFSNVAVLNEADISSVEVAGEEEVEVDEGFPRSMYSSTGQAQNHIKIKRSVARRKQLRALNKKKAKDDIKAKKPKTLREKKIEIEVKKQQRKDHKRRSSINKKKKQEDGQYQAPAYVKNGAFEGDLQKLPSPPPQKENLVCFVK